MAGKSKIKSPLLLLFFFVFLVLATDLVHGWPSAYDNCVLACALMPYGQSSCIEECAYLKIESTDERGTVAVESPRLLTGLFNHGVAILEASPNGLIAQGRLDADALFFVAQGKATADLILQQEDKRETLGLKAGDIIRIPSGTKVFMINKDTMEKLVVIKLPGQPAGQSEIKLLNPFRQSSDDHEVKLFNPFGESSSDEVKLLNPFRVSSLHQAEEGTESSVN